MKHIQLHFKPYLPYFFCLGLVLSTSLKASCCSIVVYLDKVTGKVYVMNHEDYFLSTKPYLKIVPARRDKAARMWYGWESFAQGGVNEYGLFFDAANTPIDSSFTSVLPRGNFGDKLLSSCKDVSDALLFLQENRVRLNHSHLLFADKTGKAVIVEWVNGKRELHWMSENSLVMTNFLLSDTSAGNYPCSRYHSISERILNLDSLNDSRSFLDISNVIGGAAVRPFITPNGKAAGTLYSCFLNLTELEVVFSYQLSSNQIVRLKLEDEFQNNRSRKVLLTGLSH